MYKYTNVFRFVMLNFLSLTCALILQIEPLTLKLRNETLFLYLSICLSISTLVIV